MTSRVLRISDLAADAFKDTKGKDIKNADEWKKVYEVINRLKLKVSSLAGVHSYSQWLQEEVIKRGNERIVGKRMEFAHRTGSKGNDISWNNNKIRNTFSLLQR